MLKTLSYILSFFMGKIFERWDDRKPFAEIISDQMLMIFRQLLKVSLGAVATVALAVGGILLTLVELVRQLELASPFSYAPGLWIYLAFTIGTFVALGMLMQRRRWELDQWKQNLRNPSANSGKNSSHSEAGSEYTGSQHPSPIEAAISALIFDYVEERQRKRSHNESSPGGPMPGPAPNEMRTQNPLPREDRTT